MLFLDKDPTCHRNKATILEHLHETIYIVPSLIQITGAIPPSLFIQVFLYMHTYI